MKTIYLIQHIDIPQYTKIGFTSNIDKRIKQIDTSSPTGVRIVYQNQSNYAYQLEQSLHRQYHSKHSHLEWFKLEHDDVANIIFWLEDQIEKEKIRGLKPLAKRI